ncbi:unnamed protein product [Leptidea sinapis]|uniref:Uncharacterized protein n=1 Tax=Leptidea sinapis TaxID=189913 RepID=A0A5E4QNH9_9NEOP|nr:unnamed protein product [Leptidea sinapis]
MPRKYSPADHLGFTLKCCRCIPLKAATVTIALILLLWALMQIHGSSKTMSDLIKNKKSDLYKYSKFAYIVFPCLLLMACVLLLLGVILDHFTLVHTFVWFTFVYNILYICFVVLIFSMRVITTEEVKTLMVFRLLVSCCEQFQNDNLAILKYLRILIYYTLTRILKGLEVYDKRKRFWYVYREKLLFTGDVLKLLSELRNYGCCIYFKSKFSVKMILGLITCGNPNVIKGSKYWYYVTL